VGILWELARRHSTQRSRSSSLSACPETSTLRPPLDWGSAPAGGGHHRPPAGPQPLPALATGLALAGGRWRIRASRSQKQASRQPGRPSGPSGNRRPVSRISVVPWPGQSCTKVKGSTDHRPSACRPQNLETPYLCHTCRTHRLPCSILIPVCSKSRVRASDQAEFDSCCSRTRTILYHSCCSLYS
jgi:hypothetical protein